MKETQITLLTLNKKRVRHLLFSNSQHQLLFNFQGRRNDFAFGLAIQLKQ